MSTPPPRMPPLSAEGQGRRALRRALRARRRRLSIAQQRAASARLRRLLAASPLLLGARRVGAYLPRDGELDPLPALTHLASRRVVPWLPVMVPFTDAAPRMQFAPLCAPARMRRNRFGILEPALADARAPWTLDVVLLPLVGFDRRGGRLGMGGGFYDATFDPRRPRPARPLLIGLAHELQEVDAVPMAPHDVPLDAIATDHEIIVPGRSIHHRTQER